MFTILFESINGIGLNLYFRAILLTSNCTFLPSIVPSILSSFLSLIVLIIGAVIHILASFFNKLYVSLKIMQLIENGYIQKIKGQGITPTTFSLTEKGLEAAKEILNRLKEEFIDFNIE